MRTLLTFILVSIIVLGVGPWFIVPALTGQCLNHVPATMLKWCQLFFFAPLGIVLGLYGFQKLVNDINEKYRA